MNVNEYGSTLYLSTGFDMSGYTTLQIQVRAPDGTTTTKDATLGTTTFTASNGLIFTANQYAYYVVQAGDITQIGLYGVKVLYTDSIQYLPSNYAPFLVGA